jgi:hypothetical protein
MIIQTSMGIRNLSDNEVEEMYLDYVNNYLTVDKFAEHNQISWFSADSIINKGRVINHKR